MIGSATFSIDGQYRYLLSRIWDRSKGSVCFVMLNPSKANATDSDKTIDRCISFAKSWDYGSIEVVNLFAFVSTDPQLIYSCPYPVGPENDYFLDLALKNNKEVILGWGNIGNHNDRAVLFLNKFKNFNFKCLKKNQDGSPAHPLYLPSNLKPQRY